MFLAVCETRVKLLMCSFVGFDFDSFVLGSSFPVLVTPRAKSHLQDRRRLMEFPSTGFSLSLSWCIDTYWGHLTQLYRQNEDYDFPLSCAF